MPRKTPGPPCSVCRKPSVAKGYCDKHYRRWKQYGDTTATKRPDDWGKREKHDLYGQWTWTNRGKSGRDPAWNDFWAFVGEVGDRPGPEWRLRRIDNSKPFGPGNWYWHEQYKGRRYSLETAEGKREYQRVWRANNPLRAKHHQLKAHYGIELADWNDLNDAQSGLCAICNEPQPLCVDHDHETGKVRGLLCHLCNRGLGLFNDNEKTLLSALDYLRAAKGQSAKG